LLRAFLFQALVMRYTNDHTSILQSMQRALQLAEFEQIIRPFLDYGSEIQALVNLCVDRGIMINFAKTLQSAYTRQARRAASGSTLILVPTRPLTRPLPTTDGLSGEPLTDREKEVLRLLENYLTTVEIASRLEISDRTADTIVRNICRKLGVREPGQAVMRAHDLNII
jgi:LuxR family maltose regulon positive regulatory protein